jgi:hypothetical protein
MEQYVVFFCWLENVGEIESIQKYDWKIKTFPEMKIGLFQTTNEIIWQKNNAILGAVHKWRHGLKYFVTTVLKLDEGGGSVKNFQKLRDVIYGRPLCQYDIKWYLWNRCIVNEVIKQLNNFPFLSSSLNHILIALVYLYEEITLSLLMIKLAWIWVI